MGKFHIGDRVKVINNIMLTNLDGTRTYEIPTDKVYTVIMPFTDFCETEACLVDVGVCVRPFLEIDLELVERAQEKVVEMPDNEETGGIAIDEDTYKALVRLGIIGSSVRSHNCGKSNYSEHILQPWSIWLDWNLNPWDADIVKRVLRTKQGDDRILDYEKIIHICEERIRQINVE